jgi:CubicO group peptidase (beta-lactamase class C family)
VVPVDGTCDAAFTAVRDAFAANFAIGEIGAACAIAVDGRVVVDIWGGYADEAHQRPWRRDTLVNTYSVGKPIVALSVLQLVAAGRIDLDAPADRYWPELLAGQAGATVRHALSHQAGVPAIRAPVTNDALSHWGQMCSALAATDPWWTPGTKHAYHSNTYGHLVGELSRRVDGRLPGTWLRDEIAGPLGADLAWGLDEPTQRRCADIVWQSDVSFDHIAGRDDLSDEELMVFLSYGNPPGYASVGVVNTTAWRAAQVPSVNLHATARGVTRVYEALAKGGTVDGVRVLDSTSLAEATQVQAEGWCPVLGREATFGLGVQITRPDRPFGPNPSSFGHFGAGGSLGFADPTANVAFGYVMNAVKPRWQNPRNRALVESLYSCL